MCLTKYCKFFSQHLQFHCTMDGDALTSGDCDDSTWVHDDASALSRECTKFLQKNHSNVDEHQLLHDKTNAMNDVNQHHIHYLSHNSSNS